MSTRSWYRIWPEYFALVLGLAWVPLLPRPAILFLARCFGAIGFRFARKTRQIGLDNLQLVYGSDMSEQQRGELLRETFQRFALLVLDIIWFTFRPHQRLKKWVVWTESTAPAFKDGAALMLTAHYGNWETLGQAFALEGADILSVAAELKNKPANDLFIRLRQKTGQKIIPQKGAARQLMKGLKAGSKLAVLLDQNTRPRDGGRFVRFFDLDVPVSTAPAALAVKVNAPAIPIIMTADRNGVYQVRCADPLYPDPQAKDPVLDFTQRMTTAVEAIIRQDPVHWCWMYKRWRFVPDHAAMEAYPGSYARRLNPDELET